MINHRDGESELRKRLMNSIEYFRRIDFFQDYSNLSSEEILEMIFNGEIDYPNSWQDEGEKSRVGRPHGVILRKNLREYEKDWMKRSDAEIDRAVMVFDIKRVIEESTETMLGKEIGEAILGRLARISRGVFQPTNISSRWLTPTYSK